MKITIAGKLAIEDLERLRELEAEESFWQEVSINSKEEFDEVLRSHVSRKKVYYAFMGSIIDRYSIDETKNWEISPITGSISYVEEY